MRGGIKGFGLEFEYGFGHFDVWTMIIKKTMKIEMLQIKRCKLEQPVDGNASSIKPKRRRMDGNRPTDTPGNIGVLVISTFEFVYAFSAFGLFSFAIVPLSTI